MGLWRRHPVVLEVREDASDQLALVRVARLDHRPALGIIQLPQHALARVEAELRLPLAGIGPVAAEASIREQRPDLVSEIDAAGVHCARLTGCRGSGQADRRAGEHGPQATPQGPHRCILEWARIPVNRVRRRNDRAKGATCRRAGARPPATRSGSTDTVEATAQQPAGPQFNARQQTGPPRTLRTDPLPRNRPWPLWPHASALEPQRSTRSCNRSTSRRLSPRRQRDR